MYYLSPEGSGSSRRSEHPVLRNQQQQLAPIFHLLVLLFCDLLLVQLLKIILILAHRQLRDVFQLGYEDYRLFSRPF